MIFLLPSGQAGRVHIVLIVIIFLLWSLLAAPLVAASTLSEESHRLEQQAPPHERRALALLAGYYAENGNNHRWVTPGGLSAGGAAVAALLAKAGDEGLDPSDYTLPGIPSVSDPAEAMRRELAFGRTLYRYLRDLRLGRVSPSRLGARLEVAARRDDVDDWFTRVLHANAPADILRKAAPDTPWYTGLRTLLGQYRTLAREHAAPHFPEVPDKVNPGDPWPGTPTLANWLAILGDMPQEAASLTSETYQGSVVDGVMHFQQRHGLLVDGVIGKRTLAALGTSLAERVRLIELNMERLRWYEPPARRYILVNTPEYWLRAYDPAQAGQVPVLQMPIVVGTSFNQTPTFTREMTTVVFSPYWNVPRSITIKELLPKLRQDPYHLMREKMELVGRNGEVVDGVVNADRLSSLVLGEYRIRQRPGPHNALGSVKFVFPNDDAIYMHGTPHQRLFQRSRRDFSHGCVRVEQPTALASFALQGLSTWDIPSIEAAMQTGKERHVRLAAPIPVLILYLTALPNDAGPPTFLRDIYGHDARLAQALAAYAPATYQ